MALEVTLYGVSIRSRCPALGHPSRFRAVYGIAIAFSIDLTVMDAEQSDEALYTCNTPKFSVLAEDLLPRHYTGKQAVTTGGSTTERSLHSGITSSMLLSVMRNGTMGSSTPSYLGST